jgi:hypothetical protein
MKPLCLAALALSLLSARLDAQQVSPLVRYGKWLLVAGSATMNYLAIRSHNQAEDAFSALEERCLATARRCDLAPSGRYLDPEIENFYQVALHYDRIARGWLIGGETALAGAAALFVWELTRPKGRPDNIPFEPEVRSLHQATGVGIKVGF